MQLKSFWSSCEDERNVEPTCNYYIGCKQWLDSAGADIGSRPTVVTAQIHVPRLFSRWPTCIWAYWFLIALVLNILRTWVLELSNSLYQLLLSGIILLKYCDNHLQRSWYYSMARCQSKERSISFGCIT